MKKILIADELYRGNILRSFFSDIDFDVVSHINEMVHLHGNYDLVIIPQYGRFEIADNGIRTTNHFHQFRVHALIRGIYGELNIPTKEYSLNLKDSPEKVIEDLRII